MTALTTPTDLKIELGTEAPPLGFDLNAPAIDWTMLYPSNYFNTDDIADLAQSLGGNPVFTPTKFTIKQVQDPEKPDPNKTPDLVIGFKETAQELVCNRTRCKQLAKIAGTRDMKQWAQKLPPLELYVGVEKSMSAMPQILIRPAPTTEASIDILFGEDIDV